MVYNSINENRILGSSNEVTKTTFMNYFFAPQAYVNLSEMYHKTSNIRHTFVGNKVVDDSDVVGAWPVGAAPTTSSFST